MYVTDAWSGVNLSNDGGRNWTASNQGISTRTGISGDAIPVYCLTISPQNPDVLWAGTTGVRGIFKSVDGGKTWQKKDNGIIENDGLSLRGFAVDPKNPDIVYAAGEVASWVWLGRQQNGTQAFDLVKGVVYKTTDGGESWNAIWRGDNLARYVLIDPRDSNKLLVSTGLFDRDAANEDPNNPKASGGVGILKSTDGGLNWQVFNRANGLNNLYVGSLFMNPANPDVLLAGTGTAGPGGTNTNAGAYLSSDGGQSWRLVLPQNQPISAVEYSVSNPNIAYAAGPDAVYRSSDMGRTWQKRTTGNFWGAPGTRSGFPIDLQVDPRNPDRVFANNYGGGNFLSEDGGRTWVVASQGYTGAYLHNIAVNPLDRDNVFVIGRTGPFRSYNDGDAWEGLTKDPASLSEWYAIAVDPRNPNIIIESDEHQGVIFRSTDQGSTWTLVYRHPKVNVNFDNTRMGYKALVFAPSNSRVIYGGVEINRNQVDQNVAVHNRTPGLGLSKSTDGGITWVDANDANTATQNINAIAVDPTNENIVYAATLLSGIFKSPDGGKSWQAVNQGLRMNQVLNNIDVRSLVIDPKNPQVLFAGVEMDGLYISRDGGASWQLSSSGMDPQASIRSLIVDPTNSQIIYAADIRTGVYRSDNGGMLWTRINTGLRTRAVASLAISSDGSMLYAATQGEGLFRLETAVPRY